jgi:hypothetical protein
MVAQQAEQSRVLGAPGRRLPLGSTRRRITEQSRWLEGICTPAADSGKATRVNDQLDVSVHDTEVLAEIEMMTNLIIATSESEGPLTQVRIDEILGVSPVVPRARRATP